jgi:N-acetylmuramoyl-L-alanine amidase
LKPRPKNLAALLVAPATIALTIAAWALLGRAQPQHSPNPATPQPPAAPAIGQMNLNLVVLDPAHGGPDAGAILGSNVLEKDITMAMAVRLRAALGAAGFTVVATRDANSSDPLTQLSTDQRAATANRAHAVACIVLHATNTGSGVHIYTSALPPSEPAEEDAGGFPPPFAPVPWEMAQSESVQQSVRLADDLRAALAAGNLPVTVGKASLRPLDSLMCPAVAVELAPLAIAGSGSTPVTDADYQQRVAGALAAALQAWRAHAVPPAPPAVAADSAKQAMPPAPAGARVPQPQKQVPQ